MTTFEELVATRLAEKAYDTGEDTLESLADSLADDDDFQRSVRAAVAKQTQQFASTIGGDDEPEPEFANVFEFVDQFLSRLYPVTDVRRNDVNWTGRWHEHESVVVRLSALWYRYEQLKQAEPTTYLETFLRVHADYHMDRLMADGGILADNKRNPTASHPLPTDYPEQEH